MTDNVLAEVNTRTNLALSNQMEMLIFYLSDDQLYGINVFKIIEIVECPPSVTKLPLSHPSVIGAIDFRGKSVVVIDLCDVLGLQKLPYKEIITYIIICEYNNTITGFLIKSPDMLITKSWDEIKSPTGLLANSAYLTAITYTEHNEAIQILDVEKILAEIIGISQELTADFDKDVKEQLANHTVAIVDDSNTARNMMESVLTSLNIKPLVFDSAASMLTYLEQKTLIGQDLNIDLIISDIEMPNMDGFTFVRKIRENPKLSGLKVVLHSSLSNPSNMQKAKLVGADDFLAKFSPDALAQKIIEMLRC